jgi:hypothetical protein
MSATGSTQFEVAPMHCATGVIMNCVRTGAGVTDGATGDAVLLSERDLRDSRSKPGSHDVIRLRDLPNRQGHT